MDRRLDLPPAAIGRSVRRQTRQCIDHDLAGQTAGIVTAHPVSDGPQTGFGANQYGVLVRSADAPTMRLTPG